MGVDVDSCSQPAQQVKVLDCDSISQVKEKILDAIFKSASFSSRPPKEELDLGKSLSHLMYGARINLLKGVVEFDKCVKEWFKPSLQILIRMNTLIYKLV